MTDIYCWGCEKIIGTVDAIDPDTIIEYSKGLKVRLAKCPHCGRELWDKSEYKAKVKAIPLRLLVD